MFTAWGYEVEDLPPICDIDTYNQMTGDTHAGDPGLENALAAASIAIRNVCGWHVAPSLECTARLTADGRLVKLPARLVTAISSVKENDELLTAGQFEARHDGLLRRCGFQNWAHGWDAIEVVYDAGFSLEAVPDLVNIVSHVVDVALSVPSGVTGETAGNVSITYSANEGIAARAVYNIRWALEPYRVVDSRAV